MEAILIVLSRKEVQMKKSKKEVLLRLTRFVLQNYKISWGVVAICIIISSVTSLISTLFIKSLIDDYVIPLTQVDNPEYTSLAQTLFKLALILFIGVICNYVHNLLMIFVSNGSLLKLRKDLFTSMEKLPISYVDNHSHGELMSVYTNDIDSFRDMISRSLPMIFNSLITVTITIVSMIVLSIPLTIVSLFLAFIMMRVTIALALRSRKYFMKQQEKLAEVNGFIEEMMTGQKVVQVFCHEEEAKAKFSVINEELRVAVYKANKIANIIMPVNGNLGNLGYVLIAVVGATLALTGYVSLSLGTLVSFLTLNRNFMHPVAMLSQQMNTVINASVGAERMFNLMDEKPEINDGRKEMKPENVVGTFQLNHVDFGYTPEKQVLFDINLHVNDNEKVAFVGGTGAGKTSIINLITRFYEINSGSILFDGISIKDIDKRDLRHCLGMVLQDTSLFTTTVMENIRYGRLDATDEECIEAAKLIGSDDFIRRLANGYHTMLDNGGKNLSQGERQLLAITRAAVANPPVLIMDEATSSIDTHSEQLVQKGMDILMRGRTSFIIAHRLSTVRNADLINVLEHGHIIEQGSHEQLLSLKGKYYQLYTGGSLS